MLAPGGAKAGIITKPYGLHGDVFCILEPEAGQYMETDHPLFIEIDGQRVPFFVEDLELLSDDQAIMKFEFIDSPEEARKISGCPVYLDTRRSAGSSEIGENLSDLIGFSATDPASGLHGRITDYLSHPMNPVFLILVEGKELMVPAVRNFIVHIDPAARTVQFNLPEGLTTL
jgi:16S rRNA processing protein RimM